MISVCTLFLCAQKEEVSDVIEVHPPGNANGLKEKKKSGLRDRYEMRILCWVLPQLYLCLISPLRGEVKITHEIL